MATPVRSETARATVLLPDTLAANADTYAEAQTLGAAAGAGMVAVAALPPRTTRDGGPLAIGQQFGPRYKILRLLGTGGMGAVYEARDNELSVSVALKVIKFEADADSTAAREIERRFKQELLLARQVTHRNVVRIHDLGEIEGIKYLTMSFIDGADLADVLRDVGRLEVSTALKLGRQLASGLQAAHEAGVIHRDLKPANIMIDGDRAIIMDFGIARSSKSRHTTVALTAQALSGPRHDMTTIGAMIGTLDYMAPEQARGEPVDQRVDIYAFGLIFYDMLLGSREAMTGSLPPIDALRRRMEQPPPPVSTLRPDVPAALERVITTCVQPDRDARYQSAQQLVAALEALDDEGVALPAVWRFTTRLLAAAAVAMLALLGGVWWASRPDAVAVTPDPLTVLIADFENRTNEPVFAGALEQALSIGIEGASFITTYPRQTAQTLAAQLKAGTRLTADTARLVAMREDVKVVLAGTIETSRGGYTVTATVLDPMDGRVLGTRRASARDKAGVLSAMNALAADIREVLGDRSSDASRRAGGETITSASLDAVREYAIAQDLAVASKDEDALAHYQKAIAADPSFGRAYSGFALLASRMGRDADADAAWKTAMSLTDRMTDREKYRTLGSYYMAVTRNYAKAIDNYTSFLEKYPADTSAHNNLAVAYVNTLNFAKAMDEGRALLKIYPNRVLYRTNLALYAMYGGQFEVAEVEAKTALALDVAAHKAYLALAAAALARNDVAAVRELYAKMTGAGPRGASLAALGAADFAIYEGRPRDALDALRTGIAQDAATGNTAGQAAKYVALADAYVALGERTPAAAAVQDALEASRQDPILVSGAEILLRVGKVNEARALVNELGGKLLPQPRAYARILEAEIALRDKRYSDAIETLQAGQKLADLWLGRYVLGLAYVEAGYYAEALAEFETCVKRRGEAMALFIDDMPTFRRLATLSASLARAQEGLGIKR